MPDRWPRAMKAQTAAEYCGLSLTSFHRYVQAKVAPAPIHYPNRANQESRRVAWLREDLDTWLDRLAGKAPASGDEQNPWLIDDADNRAAVPANLHG